MTVKRYTWCGIHGMDVSETGNYVKHEDYAELQRQLTAYEATVTNLTAQVQGLAAENLTLVKANKVALNILNDEETMVTSLWASSVQNVSVETPATDAALAEIRAQGVEMFAELISGTSGMLYADSVKSTLADYAQELRKEQGK